LVSRSAHAQNNDIGDSMTENPAVQCEARGQAYWITINRAERRNAINSEVIAGIRAGIDSAHDASSREDVRAIVLTGAGEAAFCAGADLKPGQSFTFDHSVPSADYMNLIRRARAATLPMIARVNGACMAGGMGLLSMCDMAIAADHAKFGMPEVKIGLFPMQIFVPLKERVGQVKLNEWCLTGEPFDAQEAKDGGLLNYVVPGSELDAKVEWLLARLIDKSPTAIRRGRYAAQAMYSMNFTDAAFYAESQITSLALTQDSAEGRAAFNEKRKPSWTGR
jgi:enoyl-CoA hydratase/carnithine racemase